MNLAKELLVGAYIQVPTCRQGTMPERPELYTGLAGFAPGLLARLHTPMLLACFDWQQLSFLMAQGVRGMRLCALIC